MAIIDLKEQNTNSEVYLKQSNFHGFRVFNLF